MTISWFEKAKFMVEDTEGEMKEKRCFFVCVFAGTRGPSFYLR